MKNIPDFYNEQDDFSNKLRYFDEILKQKKSIYFDVEVFTEIIGYLIETNQKEKAKQAMKMALRQHPHSEDLQLKRAQLSIITDDLKGAKHILKQLLNLNQHNAEVYFYLGKLQLAGNKIRKAIRYYDSALALTNFDERPGMLYMITDDMMDKGEYKAAVHYLNQILEIDSLDFEALIDLGNCYKELHQFDKAVEVFNNYLDIDPFNEMIWGQLAVIHENRLDFEAAKNAYEFAVAIEPEYTAAYFGLALIYSREGAYEKTVQHLEQLIQYDQKNVHAFFYLAEAQYQLGNKEAAMTNYEKTLAIDPEFADAWFGIGEIYYEEQKLTESLLYVRKAIKNEHEDPLFWTRLAMIQQNLKYFNYAVKSLNKVINLDAADDNVYIRLAECYFEQKNYQKVTTVCSEALNIYDNAILRYLWGAALLEMEQQSSGLAQLETGFKKDVEAFDNFVYFYPKILSFDAVKKLVNQYQDIK